ncbi:MAG: DUF4397 domain-containing protein [Burkholderiales bacterium]
MKRIVLLASILFAGILAACGSSTKLEPKANLRVMQASPDAGLIDVLLDDKTILSSFPFKDAIGFNQVNAGTRNVKFNTTAITSGTTTIPSTQLLSVTQDLVADRYYTVIAANNLAAIEPLIIDEDNSSPPDGKLRLRVVHAAPAAPAVDIYVASPSDDITLASFPPAVSNATFKTVSPSLDIAPGDYLIRVTNAGSKTVIFDSGKVTLSAGANLTLVAVEQNVAKSPISLVNLTRNFFAPKSELLDINAQVRVMHASPDIPAVDFLVANAVVQANLAYSASSVYLPLVASTLNFKINGAGTATTLVTSDPVIAASTSYTQFLMGFAASPQSVLLTDFLSPPTSGNAKLRIVHASPDAGGLDVFQDDSTTVSVTALPYKSASVYLSIPGGSHTYKFNLTGTTTAALPVQTLSLDAGRIYTAVVIGSSAAGAANPLALKVLIDR